MTNELIKYPTAVLAKEKGFDEQTRNAFIENGEEVFCDPYSVSVKLVGLGNRQGKKYWNSKEIGKYSRPSQCILQKWLREVHKIFIGVLPFKDIENSDELTWYYTVVDYKKVMYEDILCNPNHLNASDINFNSYEVALEVALVQALNSL